MKDDTIGVWHDPEVEVRIVAMVLGEASDFEKAELERMIAEDTGLKQFYVEMSELHGGIHSAVQPDDDAEWKLSTERRNSVLEKLGQQPELAAPTAVQKDPSTSRHQWRSFMSVAACLLITLFIMAVMFPIIVVTESVKSPPEIISYSAGISDIKNEADRLYPEDKIVWADEDPKLDTDEDPFTDDSGPVVVRPGKSLGEDSKRPSKVALGQSVKFKGKALPMLRDLPKNGKPFANEKMNKVAKRETSDGFHAEGRKSVDKQEMTNQVERKPSSPGSSMAKVIASNSPSVTAVPVPEITVAEPSLDFGNGDDFGDGWGDGNGYGGGFGTTHGDPSPNVDDIVSSGGKRSGDYAIARGDIGLKIADNNSSQLQIAGSVYAKKAVVVRGNLQQTERLNERKFSEEKGWDNEGSNEEIDSLANSTRSRSIVQHGSGRSASQVQDADATLLKGRKLYAEGKYGEAVEKYNKALNLLPAGEIAADRRNAYQGHVVDGSIALSQTYRRTGRYAEARQTLSEVLVKDPLNKAAKQQLEYLDDPIRTNPVLTYEHTKGTDKVRKNLYRAEGLQNLGKYDEAEEEYKEVLRVDRYNKAARLGMERIAGMKSDYYRAAYDQTRAELLMEVDKAWEIAVAPSGGVKSLQLATKQKGFSDDGVDLERLKESLVELRSEKIRAEGEARGGEFRSSTLERSSGSGSLVQHEIARRAAVVQQGDASLLEGRQFYSKGDYKSAVASYEKALTLLPTGPAVADRREAYTSHFVDGSLALASSYKNEGKLEDAKEVLKSALEKDKKNTTLGGKIKELEVQQEQVPVADEISAAEQTHSTFSLNVSDASYKLAKAALLERGEWPAAESVRTEEFINAFDYGDAKPSMAQKVACVQEQAVHPFLQQRNLLRISMSTAAQGRSTPLNLVVLLDQSGSMERPDRAATVLRAVEELSKQLGPNDRVSLMSFARDTRLLADGLSGDRAGELVGIMKNRPSEGGTNLEQAVQVAQQHLLARQKKGVQSRIVVLTDGAANLGDANPESLTVMVEKMRDAGIAFDACGIGFDGLDDGILEALTRKGDGRYYVLDKPEDADASFGKKIAGALRPAAKNVKVQLVFNPDRVGKYKLLGFEKHRLKKEDFRNDSVDAAEMAAEESGSAVYQIEPMADGSGEIGTVFVRFQDMATGQMVERSWTIPYQPKAKSLAASKPSIQLAAVAGLLGEKLHQSGAGTVDFGQINNVLGNLSSHFSGNKKVQELLQMVRKVQQ